MLHKLIKTLLISVSLAAFTITPVFAVQTTITYWSPGYGARSSTPYSACISVYPATQCATKNGNFCGTSPGPDDFNANCKKGDGTYFGDVYKAVLDCPYGSTGLYCNTSCNAPNTMINGKCTAPPPVPTCPPGASYDFDSESCKYPQDDACGSIGASWNPAASSCQCDKPTDLLVTAAGVSRCMAARDDSCTKDSPDFKGYASSGTGAGKAICDGRASCPGGGTPGYVGSGDTLTAVCINPDNTDPDSTCDGTKGLLNGVEVCVPKPGKDPDFPDCSGVVGVVNGVKQCIHKPTDHPDCKPGETAGYVGSGSEMNFTCISSDYKPDTCPPGQYITNAATGGFGCATANGQSQDDKDSGKVPGTATGTGTTTNKDAEGNVIGTEETELELDFTDLLADTPSTDFKKELDNFGQQELDGINTDDLVDSFSGADGAFTERSSLNQLSSFVKTHTIGNSATCSGTLPFFGMTISCEKFSTYNRIIGWMIFIYTLISIYNTIMRKSESGV